MSASGRVPEGARTSCSKQRVFILHPPRNKDSGQDAHSLAGSQVDGPVVVLVLVLVAAVVTDGVHEKLS